MELRLTIYQDFTFQEFADQLTKITGCEFVDDFSAIECDHMRISMDAKNYCHTDSIYLESHNQARDKDVFTHTTVVPVETTFGKLPKGFKF